MLQPNEKHVRRFDRGEIRSAIRTPEGFLKVDAIVTRTGVLRYLNPDQSIRKELRHPDDVFLQRSLDTMKMIPITKLHPTEKEVTSDNAKMLSVGFTGEDVRPDGKFIRIPLLVTAQEAIDSIENGMQELSLGYTLVLVEEPGEYDNERYDYRQTEIEYNHLAIVPNARAGAEARIKLDADDALQVDEEMSQDILVNFNKNTSSPKVFEHSRPYKGDEHIHSYMIDVHGNGKTSSAGLTPHEHRIYDFHGGWSEGHYHDLLDVPKLSNNDSTHNTPTRSNKMELINIDVNGLSYQAAPEVEKFLKAETQRANDAQTALKTAEEKVSTIQAKLDQKEDELKKATDANNDETVKEAVQQRLKLINDADPFLDEETKKKVVDMSDKEIQIAVVKSQFPDSKLDEKDDAYITARYDGVLELGPKDKNTDAMANQRKQTAKGNNTDGANQPDQDKSRKDADDYLKNAWNKDKDKKAA
jgi:hypothetical protein